MTSHCPPHYSNLQYHFLGSQGANHQGVPAMGQGLSSMQANLMQHNFYMNQVCVLALLTTAIIDE